MTEAPRADDQILEAVRALLPARVQKLSSGEGGEVLLEIYPGERHLLVVGLLTGRPVLALDPAVPPERPAKAPAAQGLLRKELVPSRLEEVVDDEARATLRLSFLRPDGGARALILERSRRDPRLLLTGTFQEAERVLAVLAGALRPADGRDLRRGRPYEPPPELDEPELLPLEGGAPPSRAAEREGADRAHLRALRAELKSEAKRLHRLIRALEDDLARHGDPDVMRLEGELLKTALGRIRRGEAEVEVVDFEGRPKTIALDLRRTPQENLEARFRKARRAEEARRRALPRLEEARSKLEKVEAARATLASEEPSAEDVARAEALLERKDATQGARRRAAADAPRKPWRAFRCRGDVVVKVGRSARDNDALTFHHANGNDLWLHARGFRGSHVIVPLGGKPPSPELLVDAAHLAVWFSEARGEERADVQYTQRKNVKKPGKGAPAGLVHVSREKVLHLKVEPERMRRLLESEVPA